MKRFWAWFAAGVMASALLVVALAIPAVRAQIPVGAQDILGQMVIGIQGNPVVPLPTAGALLVYVGPMWVPENGNQLPTSCVHSGSGIIYSNSKVLTVC